MGFDAPPINESKNRLTGKLEEVNGNTYQNTYDYSEQLIATKKLIEAISQLQKQSFPIENTIQNLLQQAGNELAQFAIDDPSKFLGLLSEIRGISDQNFLQRDALLDLKEHLVDVLPAPEQKPNLDVQPSHELLEQFVKELTKSNP